MFFESSRLRSPHIWCRHCSCLPCGWRVFFAEEAGSGSLGCRRPKFEGQWRLLFRFVSGVGSHCFSRSSRVHPLKPGRRGGDRPCVWIVYAVTKFAAGVVSCCVSRRTYALDSRAGQVRRPRFSCGSSASWLPSPLMTAAAFAVLNRVMGVRLEPASSGSAGNSGGNIEWEHHFLQCFFSAFPHVHVRAVVHLSVGRAHGGSFPGMLKRAKYQIWAERGTAADENHANGPPRPRGNKS